MSNYPEKNLGGPGATFGGLVPPCLQHRTATGGHPLLTPHSPAPRTSRLWRSPLPFTKHAAGRYDYCRNLFRAGHVGVNVSVDRFWRRRCSRCIHWPFNSCPSKTTTTSVLGPSSQYSVMPDARSDPTQTCRTKRSHFRFRFFCARR